MKDLGTAYEGSRAMALSTEQQILIEQRITNDGKSAVLAYILWFFVGGLGGHRFYLGKTGSGAAMAALFVVGLLTTVILVGFVLLFAVGIWAIVDAFLIPGMITEQKNELRRQLTQSFMVGSPQIAPQYQHG